MALAPMASCRFSMGCLVVRSNSFPVGPDVEDPGPSFTHHVVGPVNPLPEQAPFLPIRVREKPKRKWKRDALGHLVKAD